VPVLLLVEDHADTRTMYAEFLRDIFDVAQAADGDEALAWMRERAPDLVITDLSLPQVDGFELVKRMRADETLAAVPVICLSGYSDQAHEQRALDAGADRVLQKPCLPDRLAQAAVALLRDRASADADR
jgi:DNA-binding response OmpR family regulator